jgi:hypothetical protein
LRVHPHRLRNTQSSTCRLHTSLRAMPSEQRLRTTAPTTARTLWQTSWVEQSKQTLFCCRFGVHIDVARIGHFGGVRRSAVIRLQALALFLRPVSVTVGPCNHHVCVVPSALANRSSVQLACLQVQRLSGAAARRPRQKLQSRILLHCAWQPKCCGTICQELLELEIIEQALKLFSIT